MKKSEKTVYRLRESMKLGEQQFRRENTPYHETMQPADNVSVYNGEGFFPRQIVSGELETSNILEI